MGPVTYLLKLPKSWQMHLVIHMSSLLPYCKNTIHGPNYLEPPPDLINRENEWEIEAITGHKGQGPQCQYLIKWKGYRDNDNTWEPESNLDNAAEELEEYKK